MLCCRGLLGLNFIIQSTMMISWLHMVSIWILAFEKREQEHSESVSAQAEENTNDEENDLFWCSEEIPVETKNMLDDANATYRDASFTQLLKAPIENDPFWCSEEIPVETRNMLDDANATYWDASFTQLVKDPAELVVLEGDCQDSTGDSGELESYLGNFVGSKNQKSFLSPTRCSVGIANKLSAQKNQDANFCVSPMVEPEFDPGSYNGDCDIPDNYDDGHGGEDGFLEPRGADDSDDEDTWKPLNPHEPGTLKVKP